jgi:hypothetical protein
MNLFSSATWLWRALRGQSVTFAALFALALLGLSVVRILRHLLAAAGVPWLALLIIPALVIGYLARHEEQWVPDVAIRRRWARRLVFGSIGIAVALSFLKPRFRSAPVTSSQETPAARQAPTKMHGPSGK